MPEDTSSLNAFPEIEARLQGKSKNNRSHILYLTFDGVMEPLGQSQVLRYLCGLSDRGFLYFLISLEREHDLANREAVRETEELLCRHAIEWVRLPYEIG